MNISYKLNYLDYLIYIYYNKISNKMTFLVYFVFIAFMMYVFYKNDYLYMLIIFIFSVIVSVALIIANTFLNSFTFYLKKNKNLRVQQNADINENGIHFKSEIEDSIIYWNAIINIKNKRRFILIYVYQNAAIILPKRCFNSETQAKQSCAFIENHWKKQYTAK